MTATPPHFETLFPQGSVASRAQRLALVRPERSCSAWITHAEGSDLAGCPAESYLHPSESGQAAAFRFAARRQTFLLGRLAAKAAVGAYLAESDWTRLELTHGVFGQPLVNYPVSNDVEVSLSHSGGRAVALAFPRECPMAIDMETVDHDRAATVKSELQFLPEEREWIKSAAVDERAAYVLLWTVREALGKVLRCGLTCPLELLAVDQVKPVADGLWESSYRNFSQFKCLSWMRADLVVSLTLPKMTDFQACLRRG